MASNRKQIMNVRGHWKDVEGDLKPVLAYPLTVENVRFGVYQVMPKKWISFEVLTGLKVAEGQTRSETEKMTKNAVGSVRKAVQKLYTDEADRRQETHFFSPCANEMTHQEFEALTTGTFAD